MKAFFHRLHLGGGAKDKDRDSVNAPKEKFPPLPSWPPQETPRPTSTATVPSVASLKPLPELVPAQLSSQLSTRPLPPIHDPSPSPSHNHTSNGSASSPKQAPIPLQAEEASQESSGTTSESAGRSSRKTNGSVSISAAADVQKKVAFLSPPQTPVDFERALPDAPAAAAASTPTPVPLKTTVSRFQAVYGKEPRGSISSGGSSSKVDVATTSKQPVKAPSARNSSPYIQKPIEGSSQSLRSGTPYSQMSANTSGSRILAAQSWSEVTEDDLVSNLGMRERTRQEVLFEIISSEERYVQELVKMKDTFIDPLLHPYSMTAASAASTPNLDYDYYRSESPFESTDDLPPIAARFMSPTPSMNPPSTVNRPQSSASPRPRDAPVIDGESLETDEDDEAGDRAGTLYDTSRRPGTSTDHPRSPYRITATRSGGRASGVSVPFPSRSHMSLPPAPRNPLSTSTHSLGRQSLLIERERERERERDRKFSQGQSDSPQKGMLKKFRRSQTATEVVLGNTIAPHQLPEDLRICLEVIDSGVFDGHKRLSEALKKRYDDQFPLVRSLADVFVSNSDIFHGYATYVLHLERALEQVDAALSNVSTKKPKKQDVGEWQKVCKFLQKLEENASDKGETGLAITLSKPFQRLLKYPLLFQNLLFHTDPSTFEYESTLQMVAEVENIVRSIEDEKIQKEERDKTRDVFARIEGLDKVRQVALPKPSRVLLEERSCSLGLGPVNVNPKPASPPPINNGKAIRGKSSFKRLSDVLSSNGVGGKKDLWFVIFNDVVLQCQRIGTTSLPLVASTNSRTNSLPEFQGKAKYATTGRRNSATKPRNMYKFIKIETWDIGNVLQPREGVVAMEDMAKSRAQALSSQPRIVPLPDDDENNDDDSDDSDKKSKMSFSYWGADKVTVQKPVLKGRAGVNPRRGGGVASYGRESSANAKFGTRLVSDGSSHNPRPPSSRRTTTTPTPRRPPPPSDEGPNYARATITRPAWDTSTRTPIPNPTTKRTRNPSQVSPATRTPIASPKNPVASPAPSEDSGVGLYRQMLAKDPSFNDTS
ncbi:RhoGEF domain-containing protein gxcJ [Psilocybe cubensis]|uniref:RhoGEF domain-containing protein gxcJ n=2 Tax=Psilocybe cubensis TaxID=181762 RepID=A0ACB8HAN9_PSICU|nr:RhoGEF domain-containing protein gxcJ [Psilocybe cubensis]KAH9484220.1 RhoGEF domain-containing protein gxcJ [Psilocybe cubensis]